MRFSQPGGISCIVQLQFFTGRQGIITDQHRSTEHRLKNTALGYVTNLPQFTGIADIRH